VTDPNKHTASITRTILVREHCPGEMVSVAEDTGRSFCIDKYEWPNEVGKAPQTNVSWVEAKIACIDAGKRLCSRKEWQVACRSGTRNVYPYGDVYDNKQCSTEGIKPSKSGFFRKCSSSGLFDMVGNVWEWVEDKQGDYPIMLGGSYNDGKDAHCSQLIPGTVAVKASDAGFRCCK
jgi:eukaryotic-like serine/threonine-protein kinase